MARIIQTVARPPFGLPVFAPDVVPDYRGGQSRAWSPLDIPNIIDYGIRNLSNMYVARTGSGAQPTSNGDTVGTWNGELGVYSFRSTSDTFRPILGVNGVRFTGVGEKDLRNDANISIAYNDPITFAVIERYSVKDFTSPVNFTYSNAGGVVMVGRNSYAELAQSFARNGTGSSKSVLDSYEGTHCFAGVSDGATAWCWIDDAKSSITTGSNTDAFSYNLIRNNDIGKDGTVVAWIAIADDISDADWSRVIEWGNAL